jgi:hypothetical protein
MKISRPFKFLVLGSFASFVVISILDAPNIKQIGCVWVVLVFAGCFLSLTSMAKSHPVLLFCLPFFSMLVALF